MARDENPPFSLGSTWHNGGTIDANNLQDTHLEGQEWVFDDVDLSSSSGAKPTRTPFKKRGCIVRNASGIAILPNRAVTWQATAGNYGKRVDGYCDLTNEKVAGIVDDFLPTAGCPNNDMCWLIVEGPVNVLTDLANGVNNNIAIGDLIGALTAVTSQATTAGRMGLLGNTSGATVPLFESANNVLGRALSARTTNQTNTATLVYVNGGRI